MDQFHIFVTNNMAYIVGFSSVLQVIGTLILGLFSLNGVKVSPSSNVFTNGNPASNVIIDDGWISAAKVGLVCLLFGIAGSGLAGIIASVSV